MTPLVLAMVTWAGPRAGAWSAVANAVPPGSASRARKKVRLTSEPASQLAYRGSGLTAQVLSLFKPEGETTKLRPARRRVRGVRTVGVLWVPMLMPPIPTVGASNAEVGTRNAELAGIVGI